MRVNVVVNLNLNLRGEFTNCKQNLLSCLVNKGNSVIVFPGFFRIGNT